MIFPKRFQHSIPMQCRFRILVGSTIFSFQDMLIIDVHKQAHTEAPSTKILIFRNSKLLNFTKSEFLKEVKSKYTYNQNLNLSWPKSFRNIQSNFNKNFDN